jgi:predicted RNase H-like nuclease (RuvC/YqgF family)
MIDHPERIPTEILDYSYLNSGPVKYIREDVVMAEIKRLMEERDRLYDREATMAKELEEQSRIIGMSGEREARHLAEIQRLRKSGANLLDRLEKFIDRRFVDDGPDREYNKLHDAMEQLRGELKEERE